MPLSLSGESEGNLTGIMDGQGEAGKKGDLPLTAEGVRQVERAGRRLADVPFTRAYASDLIRAFDTARAIVQANKAGFDDVNKIEVRLEEGFLKANYASS